MTALPSLLESVYLSLSLVSNRFKAGLSANKRRPSSTDVRNKPMMRPASSSTDKPYGRAHRESGGANCWAPDWSRGRTSLQSFSFPFSTMLSTVAVAA